MKSTKLKKCVWKESHCGRTTGKQTSPIYSINGRKLRRFLHRPNMMADIRRPTGTPFACAVEFNKQSIDKFFDLLEKVMDYRKFSASHVFNVDESGICIVHLTVHKYYL